MHAPTQGGCSWDVSGTLQSFFALFLVDLTRIVQNSKPKEEESRT